MEIKLNDYIHLYLGCEVFVQKKQGNENLLRGRMCDVTNGSNHGDWIRVSFETCVTVINSNFEEVKSNFHTFFIGEDMIKLSLRRLSSMTEEEAIHLFKLNSLDDKKREFTLIEKDDKCITMNYKWKDELYDNYYHSSYSIYFNKETWSSKQFVYFLSKNFDLFSLIDAGLAIENDTV